MMYETMMITTLMPSTGAHWPNQAVTASSALVGSGSSASRLSKKILNWGITKTVRTVIATAASIATIAG